MQMVKHRGTIMVIPRLETYNDEDAVVVIVMDHVKQSVEWWAR